MIDLLQRALASPPSAAREHLTAALRAGGESIWVARNVARIYRTHVDDRDAARRVIADLEPLTCKEWRLVAAAWCELDDHETAGKCLERAANNARTPTDLCIVAMGYRDAGFEDESRLLVDGAARVATLAMDAWIVANCYRDTFGEPDRARALLDGLLRETTVTSELLVLARAFSAHDADRSELATILEHAERGAQTVDDWLDTSRAHHRVLDDIPRGQTCVFRAQQLAASPQDQRAIAIARGLLQTELLDEERPKWPPSKLLQPGARSFAWDRDPNRLLGWLRARIPRTSINTLARPDRFFFNDDLVTLLDLQKSGNIPHPLPAHLDVLREVADRTGDIDHQLRAFACTVLCVDAAATHTPDIEPIMGRLLESCFALGVEAIIAAQQLFAALADSYESMWSDLVLYAERGLVTCASYLDPTDPRIAPLHARLDGISLPL